MKLQVTNVSAQRAGRTSAFIYFALTHPFILFGILQLIIGGKDRAFGLLFLLAPFLYFAIGYMFGVLSALVYNFAASRFGGLEITVQVIDDQYQDELMNSDVR